MKSTVPPHVTTWQQFVDYNFTAKLTSLHGAYKNVILSFDNYECVPVGRCLSVLALLCVTSVLKNALYTSIRSVFVCVAAIIYHQCTFHHD